MPVYRYATEIGHTGGSPLSANVWHFRTVLDGGADDLQIDAAMGAIRQFYLDVAGSLASGTTVAFPEYATEVTTNTDAQVGTFQPVAGPSLSQAPAVLAICVNWSTSLRARRGRGRTFVGPLNINTIAANGIPAASTIALYNTAAETLVGSSTGGNGWSVGIWGQQDQYQPLPKVLRDITGFSVNPRQFSVMTSRRKDS